MVQNTLKVEEDMGGVNDNKKYFKVKETKIKKRYNREDNRVQNLYQSEKIVILKTTFNFTHEFSHQQLCGHENSK